MPRSRFFISHDPILQARAATVASRLPQFRGLPIQLHRVPGLQDRRGPVHAASFLRQRRIAFDCTTAEFPRIFVHELFHFVWLHAGNPLRWCFEEVINAEFRAGARGELGWSAEWRKEELPALEIRDRNRSWREYLCESFCDTAAWLYSGVKGHPEFTLAERYCKLRRRCFEEKVESRALSI